MRKHSILLKRFASIFSASILNSVFNFIFFTVLSINLSLAVFGEFSYYYSLIFLLFPFIELGISTLLLSNDDKTIQEDILIFGNWIFLVCSLISIFILFFNPLIGIIGLNISFIYVFQIIYSLLIKNKKTTMQMNLIIISGIIKILGIIIFINIDSLNNSNEIFNLMIILLLSNLLPSVLIFTLEKNIFSVRVVKSIKFQMIVTNLKWIALSTIVVALLMRMDQILVGKLIDKETLGQYAIAIQWLTVISIISNSILKFSFSETENVDAKKYYNFLIAKKMKIMLISLFSFSLFLTMICLLTYFIYKNNELILASLLLLSLGYLFSLYYNFYSVILYKISMTKLLFQIQVLQLLIQFLLILTLLPILNFFVFPLSFTIVRIMSYIYLSYKIKKIIN